MPGAAHHSCHSCVAQHPMSLNDGRADRRARPRLRSPCRCSATRTMSASTASTASSVGSRSLTPPPILAPCTTRQHRECGLSRYRLPLCGQHSNARGARPEARFQRPKPPPISTATSSGSCGWRPGTPHGRDSRGTPMPRSDSPGVRGADSPAKNPSHAPRAAPQSTRQRPSHDRFFDVPVRL